MCRLTVTARAASLCTTFTHPDPSSSYLSSPCTPPPPTLTACVVTVLCSSTSDPDRQQLLAPHLVKVGGGHKDELSSNGLVHHLQQWQQ